MRLNAASLGAVKKALDLLGERQSRCLRMTDGATVRWAGENIDHTLIVNERLGQRLTEGTSRGGGDGQLGQQSVYLDKMAVGIWA